MRHLVRDPQWQQMGCQPHPVRLRVRAAGEVLEADERHAPPAHHELARVRGAHADHEVEVHRAVGVSEVERALHRLLGDRHDIDVLEQPLQIRAVGVKRREHDLLGMRRGRVEHVVVPVAGEHRLVPLEILVIGRQGIGRGTDREELRHEIDEHGARGRPQFGKPPPP